MFVKGARIWKNYIQTLIKMWKSVKYEKFTYKPSRFWRWKCSSSWLDERFDKFLHFAFSTPPRGGPNAKIYRMVYPIMTTTFSSSKTGTVTSAVGFGHPIRTALISNHILKLWTKSPFNVFKIVGNGYFKGVNHVKPSKLNINTLLNFAIDETTLNRLCITIICCSPVKSVRSTGPSHIGNIWIFPARRCSINSCCINRKKKKQEKILFFFKQKSRKKGKKKVYTGSGIGSKLL